MSVNPGLIIGGCAEAAILIPALVLLARTTRNGVVVRLTLGSFLLRIAIGELLYLTSLLRLPILAALQLPNGFWKFGYDGWLSNSRADAVLDFVDDSRIGAIRAVLAGDVVTYLGVRMQQQLTPFERFLTGLYSVFGFNPSQGLMLLAAAAAACVPPAYVAARAVGLGPAPSAIAAATVGFWPSSLIWSGLILRDALEWFALWLVLAGFALLLDAREQTGRRRVVGSVLAVGVGVLITYNLRSYTFVFCAIAMAVGFMCWVIQTKRGMTLLAACVFAGLSIVALFVLGVQRPAHDGGQSGICPATRPLIIARQGFETSSSASQLSGDGGPRTCLELAAFAPRALELVFLAPTPATWLKPGATSGELRVLAPLDVMLLWLLVPGLVVGAFRALVRPSPGRLFLTVYVLLFGYALGTAVTIFGALFRLRLQVVIPAALISLDGWCALLRWATVRLSSTPLRRLAMSIGAASQG